LNPEAVDIVRADTVQEAFIRVLAEVEALVAAVQPEQLSESTPCSGFDVRALVNHMIFENLAHAALADGSPIPSPDATTDYVGSDHRAAYRDSALAVRGALSRPELLEQRYGPAEAPGSLIVQQAIIELLTHGWDLAKATGQPTNLAPDVAEHTLGVVRVWYRDQPRTLGSAFAPEQPVSKDASAADRLAAYLGRAVTHREAK
jgi:uncharacterized protein (TIGR03086 family)